MPYFFKKNLQPNLDSYYSTKHVVSILKLMFLHNSLTMNNLFKINVPVRTLFNNSLLKSGAHFNFN
jgi:hypothetical protein